MKVNTVDGVAVISLYGSWNAMGRQYGLLAKEKMEDVLKYLDRKIGDDPGKIADAYDISRKLYSNYPDYLKDFFDGVASASGLCLERVELCNAVEYVEGVFLCSAFAVWGDNSRGGLVFGRNYDAVSYSEIDRDVIVTVYHPDDGPAAATVGYAGEIYCVNGMNSEGIFVELNNGMPSAGTEIHWELLPGTTALFEMLFSARNLDDVDDFFRNTRSSASFIIGVADGSGARSYEWCFDGVRRGDDSSGGLMIITNHYVNGLWPYPVPSDRDSWNSISRRCNLSQTARRFSGSIDVEKMKEIMSTPIADGGPSHNLTRYRIVAVPGDRILHIYIPSNGLWAEINLNEFF